MAAASSERRHKRAAETVSRLKPCWWCGASVACYPHRRGNNRRTGERFQAVCHGMKCRARGPIRDTEQQAIDSHNVGPM